MILLSGQEQLDTLSNLREQYKSDDERPTRAMEDEALCEAQLKKDREEVIAFINSLDNGTRSSPSWRHEVRLFRQALWEEVK